MIITAKIHRTYHLDLTEEELLTIAASLETGYRNDLRKACLSDSDKASAKTLYDTVTGILNEQMGITAQ